MMYVALGVIGFGAFLLLSKLLWSQQLPSKNTRIIIFATIALVVVLGILVLLAKIPPLVALCTAILPFVRLICRLALTAGSFLLFRRAVGPARFGFNPGTSNRKYSNSETRTSELDMKLNHQTGTMTGTVLNGKFSGQTLDSLSDEDLHSVYLSLQEEESKRLLEAYVARHRPHLNEESSETNERVEEEQMSVKRAADILGIDVKASKEEIVASHRRLMEKLHPDKGGSSYLAAELNEAKQVLLAALG